MVTYNEIIDEIANLPRRDQYRRLLKTKEWFRFRNNIISLGNHKCNNCHTKEGYIELKRPIEEVRKEREEVLKHNAEFKRKLKDPDFSKLQMSILLGEVEGNYEGLHPMPVDTVIVGEIVLQVHHKLYFFDSLPWQYDSMFVEPLCSSCHRQVHLLQDIVTYKDQSMTQKKVFPRCKKCHGEGYLGQYCYRDHGICYECGGQGIIYDGSIQWESA